MNLSKVIKLVTEEGLEPGITDFWPLFFLLHCELVFSIFKMIILSRVIIPEEKLALNNNIIIITNIYCVFTIRQAQFCMDLLIIFLKQSYEVDNISVLIVPVKLNRTKCQRGVKSYV